MEFSSMKHGKKYKTQQYAIHVKWTQQNLNVKLSMMQLNLFFHYFFSPNIPANVVLRSFIVSSPSRSSSPSPWSKKVQNKIHIKTLHCTYSSHLYFDIPRFIPFHFLSEMGSVFPCFQFFWQWRMRLSSRTLCLTQPRNL